jgi:hypothetical protein
LIVFFSVDQTGPDPSQNCSLPYLALYSFFASETFKIATPPTGQLPPPPPAYTVYKQLDWRVPGDLPVEQADSTSSKVCDYELVKRDGRADDKYLVGVEDDR